MYKSPIEIIYGQLNLQFENDLVKAVQDCEIHVDKEELIKALKYDREQYEKGYKDAKALEEKSAKTVGCYGCANRYTANFLACDVCSRAYLDRYIEVKRYDETGNDTDRTDKAHNKIVK